jgi:hypothetical protein
MAILLQRARWPQLLGLVSVLFLAACGAAPPSSDTENAPTTYPAPDAAPSAYPAPAENAVPTAYPAPLGGAGDSQPTGTTAAAAPTRPPMVTTVAPTTSGSSDPAATPAAVPSLAPGSTGEVPEDKVAQAIADLTQRTGAAAATVAVVSAEVVEWSDGSLGCPQPDMVYLQVITPGYKLVLETGGKQYNYHASTQGDFFLCEGRSL